MEEQLLAHFNSIRPLSPEEQSAITETICIRSFPKGAILLREGDISAEAYFVLRGCVRLYYLNEGDEKTTNFFTENQWVISMQSMTFSEPSRHFLECCEDTQLVVGNREKEEDLYQRFPELQQISRRVMERVFAEQQELSGSQVTESPEERYLNLLKKRPELLQRLPQYLIASYIGVKPESLSRIRKRISEGQR